MLENTIQSVNDSGVDQVHQGTCTARAVANAFEKPHTIEMQRVAHEKGLRSANLTNVSEYLQVWQ